MCGRARSSVKRRTKNLPAEQQEQNEQQHGIATDRIRTGDVTEMSQQAEDEPNQHQNPITESECHCRLPTVLQPRSTSRAPQEQTRSRSRSETRQAPTDQVT